jgi:hypothetical protein
MRISREEALAFASAKKKLLTVKKGNAWLFAPYMPGAAYHSVHWDHEQKVSVQCEGASCSYCPKVPNKKVHIPSLVCKKPYRIETVDSLRFPQGIFYNSAHWGDKIVELTSGCFAALELPSEPNQLAIAWRPGPRQNGPLHFKWLEGTLKNIPEDLEELDVNKVLPGIIGGRYVDSGPLPLTEQPTGRIKHNVPYQTLEVDNPGDTPGYSAIVPGPNPDAHPFDERRAVPHA